MEIVHVVRQYRPSVGGLEDAVHNLCTHLARRPGVRVRVITLDRWFVRPEENLPAHEIIDGISVTRLPYAGSKRYPFAPSVLKEIRSASLVHVHAIDFFFDFLALTAWIHHKPMVASTHGGFFHTSFASSLKKIWFSTLTRFSSRAYAALCASSENDAATFRCIAGDKVVAIENGVNVEKWKNCASPSLERHMIYIGRWSSNKRLRVLIDLIAALKAAGATWALTIAGLPGEETEDSLRAHAEQAGVASQVMLSAAPSEEEIARLIRKASYIASASAYEGFGISIIEGLSAGLLPLISPIPTFEKLRNILGFGPIIQPDDLARTAQDIESFHAQAATETEQLTERARELSQRYDWAGVTDRFMEVYESTLKGSAR